MVFAIEQSIVSTIRQLIELFWTWQLPFHNEFQLNFIARGLETFGATYHFVFGDLPTKSLKIGFRQQQPRAICCRVLRS